MVSVSNIKKILSFPIFLILINSDLVRSVYRKHDSVMEEIDHINNKINVWDKKINMMISKIDDIFKYTDFAHINEITLNIITSPQKIKREQE